MAYLRRLKMSRANREDLTYTTSEGFNKSLNCVLSTDKAGRFWLWR